MFLYHPVYHRLEANVSRFSTATLVVTLRHQQEKASNSIKCRVDFHSQYGSVLVPSQ